MSMVERGCPYVCSERVCLRYGEGVRVHVVRGCVGACSDKVYLKVFMWEGVFEVARKVFESIGRVDLGGCLRVLTGCVGGY